MNSERILWLKVQSGLLNSGHADTMRSSAFVRVISVGLLKGNLIYLHMFFFYCVRVCSRMFAFVAEIEKLIGLIGKNEVGQ